jgi:hypothetical protein
MRPPPGGPADVLSRPAGRPCSPTTARGILAAPSGSPPLPRAPIVEPAGLGPVAKGLHITHGAGEDPARQAVLDSIVPAIRPSTVRRILNSVDRQPHRARYWRTAHRDARSQERAEQVLWCYANAGRLAERGIRVVCTDARPDRQVLERCPIRRAIPGSIEQQEFEYTRHGTVDIPTSLVVHTGEMEAVCLKANNAGHSIPEPDRCRREHRKLRGVSPVQDGGASPIAGETADSFAGCQGWWRPRLTPAQAAWLNQGELLNHAFGCRYRKRGSWTSQEAYIAHVEASWPEYNRL